MSPFLKLLWVAIPLSVIGLSMGWAGSGSSRAPDPPRAISERETDDDPRPTTLTAPTVDPAVVDEIVRLRDAQRNLFRGTVFDFETGDSAGAQSESAEFREILTRIARKSPRPSLPHVTPDECASNYELWVAQQGTSVGDRLVPSMRLTARLLDEKANDLEDARQFDEADRFRELAGQLRAEARELESP